MCNINVVINKDKEYRLPTTAIDGLIPASAISYAANRDADGIYIQADDKLLISSDKLPLHRYIEDMEISDILISHQRISTSGHTAKNHQPLRCGRFVFAHNGMLQVQPRAGKSDSKIFLELLEKNAKEMPMKKAIEKTFADNDIGGSYSIFIYDIETSTTYYFKNLSTSMFYGENDSFICFSTKKENLSLYPVDKIKDVKAGRLYEFSYKNGHLETTDEKLKIDVRYSRDLWNDCDYDYCGSGYHYSRRQSRTIASSPDMDVVGREHHLNVGDIVTPKPDTKNKQVRAHIGKEFVVTSIKTYYGRDVGLKEISEYCCYYLWLPEEELELVQAFADEK